MTWRAAIGGGNCCDAAATDASEGLANGQLPRGVEWQLVAFVEGDQPLVDRMVYAGVLQASAVPLVHMVQLPSKRAARRSVELWRIGSSVELLSNSDGKSFRSPDQKGVKIRWTAIDEDCGT
ncbi:hypothetical protein Syun_001467 [Stephania yunnanensis]|uniref:Uncharacterized protein n=1 Tax=Stephania yunnanensis TaxID=152371 RepID=A0AAP0Q6B1_9MAGN